MSRTKNRLAVITLGTAGLFLAVPLFSPAAAADPTRGGVPCLGIVHQIATSPASIPQSLQTAASAFTAGPPQPLPPVVVPPATAVGAVSPPAPPLPSASVIDAAAGTVTPPSPPAPAVPSGSTVEVVTPPSPPGPSGPVQAAAGTVTPPSPPTPAVPVANSVQGATPPIPPASGSSVGATASSATPPVPGTPGTSVTAADLLTPPGILRQWSTRPAVAVDGAGRRLVGRQRHAAPGAASPGHCGRRNGRPAACGPTDRSAGDRYSNLVSPPTLIMPDVPGLPVPLPNGIPVPSDLICVGTDWSASQGDPGAPLAAQPTPDRRDRW